MSVDVAVPVPKVSAWRFHRWWLPVGELTIAVAAQGILWQVFAEDRTYSAMSVLFVWPAAIFGVFLWWLLLSRYRWRTRFGVLGVLAAVFGVLAGLFRIDDADGDMKPIVVWRWAPRADVIAREYFAKQQQEQSGQPAVLSPVAETAWQVTADDWPGYRGLLRDGIVRHGSLRRNWSEQLPRELWRHPVGAGWSSFAVVADRAVTQEQRDGEEVVVCYAVETGEQVWVHRDATRFDHAIPMGGPGPRATPQVDETRLYALGATGVLNCLEAPTGKPLWQRDILKDAGKEAPAKNLEWGMAGSPLIAGDLVIVNPGGSAGKSVAAYHKLTGEPVWQQGSHPASYCAPRLATLGGVEQVLIFSGDGIGGHRLTDGQELWFYAWENDPKVNAAQPIPVDADSVVFGCGYGVGSARIRLTASDNGPWQAELAWKTNRLKPKFNDVLLKDGYLYGLDDGILTCVEVETGKPKWKKGRYNYGQLLLIGDVILVLSEQGDVVLVPATPKAPEEIASFKALPEGTTWNHPVLCRGKLLVRNGREAACYDVGEPEKTTQPRAEEAGGG